MTRIKRLEKKFPGEFHVGARIANRMHVSASDISVLRACWKALGNPKRNPSNFARDKRDARHALFRGALAAHKANRDLFQHFRF